MTDPFPPPSLSPPLPLSLALQFDAFAASGTRFDQAHVSYTVCSQSRVAFMTGWPTHVRGHRTLWSLLHDWEPNMLKYFKTAGCTSRWGGRAPAPAAALAASCRCAICAPRGG